jgi:hypothetical protein
MNTFTREIEQVNTKPKAKDAEDDTPFFVSTIHYNTNSILTREEIEKVNNKIKAEDAADGDDPEDAYFDRASMWRRVQADLRVVLPIR